MFENQRKIEFRIWDRQEKIFITEGATISLDGTVNPPATGEGRHILSQYIGRKDSTRSEEFPEGRKLFENDIVQHIVRKKTGVIQYDKDFAGFYICFPVRLKMISRYNFETISRYWKKTGDCFQNPELLKKTDSSGYYILSDKNKHLESRRSV